MENLCKGAIFGLAAGMIIGGIAVAKNKKLATKIKSYLSGASEKFEEAKEMLDEKIEEVQTLKESLATAISEGKETIAKEMNKKSKN